MWRNWQTRSVQGAVGIILCGFKSHHPHSKFSRSENLLPNYKLLTLTQQIFAERKFAAIGSWQLAIKRILIDIHRYLLKFIVLLSINEIK